MAQNPRSNRCARPLAKEPAKNNVHCENDGEEILDSLYVMAGGGDEDTGCFSVTSTELIQIVREAETGYSASAPIYIALDIIDLKPRTS